MQLQTNMRYQLAFYLLSYLTKKYMKRYSYCTGCKAYHKCVCLDTWRESSVNARKPHFMFCTKVVWGVGVFQYASNIFSSPISKVSNISTPHLLFDPTYIIDKMGLLLWVDFSSTKCFGPNWPSTTWSHMWILLKSLYVFPNSNIPIHWINF